jgi:hypothetical protein
VWRPSSRRLTGAAMMAFSDADGSRPPINLTRVHTRPRGCVVLASALLSAHVLASPPLLPVFSLDFHTKSTPVQKALMLGALFSANYMMFERGGDCCMPDGDVRTASCPSHLSANEPPIPPLCSVLADVVVPPLCAAGRLHHHLLQLLLLRLRVALQDPLQAQQGRPPLSVSSPLRGHDRFVARRCAERRSGVGAPNAAPMADSTSSSTKLDSDTLLVMLTRSCRATARRATHAIPKARCNHGDCQWRVSIADQDLSLSLEPQPVANLTLRHSCPVVNAMNRFPSMFPEHR